MLLIYELRDSLINCPARSAYIISWRFYTSFLYMEFFHIPNGVLNSATTKYWRKQYILNLMCSTQKQKSSEYNQYRISSVERNSTIGRKCMLRHQQRSHCSKVSTASYNLDGVSNQTFCLKSMNVRWNWLISNHYFTKWEWLMNHENTYSKKHSSKSQNH